MTRLMAILLAAGAMPVAVASAQDATVAAAASDPRIVRIREVLTRSGFHGDMAVSFDGARLDYDNNSDNNGAGGGDHAGHRWRWASVTKQVVAILVMQEVAAGHIDLDRPIARYLPGFASANAKTATVRQLLRHQAGLPNPDDTAANAEAFPAYYQAGYAGSRDPLTGYCAGTPKAAPGGKWEYNNCDYIVAGALLRAVTGKPWSQLAMDRIVRPLGLKTVGVYPTRHPTRPGFYDGKPEPKIDMASYGASAGLFGAPRDLLKIDLALLGGKLLAKAQLDEMWDGQPKLGYIALGQWVFDAKLKDCPAPVRLVERRGAIGGVEVRNFILPARTAAMVVFTDRSPLDFGEIWQGKGFSHDLLNAAFCTAARK